MKNDDTKPESLLNFFLSYNNGRNTREIDILIIILIHTDDFGFKEFLQGHPSTIIIIIFISHLFFARRVQENQQRAKHR